MHGKKVEWEKFRELGFCIGLEEGPVDMRYVVSYVSSIVEKANSISKQEALDEARKMHKKSLEQLGHKTLEALPRFKQGVGNAIEFYQLLTKALEN